MTHRAPSVAAITFAPRGDGVAVVAQLIDDAVQARWGSTASRIAMFDGPARAPRLLDKLSFTTRLALLLAARRPSWVLFAHIGLARALKLWPKALRPRYGVFLHGTEAWTRLSAEDTRLLAEATVRISNSQHTAYRVAAAHPELGAISPCHLAVSSITAGTHQAALSLPAPFNDPEALVVVIVGALRAGEGYKGHDELIAAWPAVVRDVSTAHLAIIGDGSDRARLEAAVSRSPVAGRIAVLGFLPAPLLDACLSKAALFAMPSRGEGFGLAYVEAMRHGLPCLASRDDAACEVVRDGESGVLVEQRDIAGIARAIVALLRDPERRRALGEAGRRRALQQFSVEAFRSRLYPLLDAAFGREV